MNALHRIHLFFEKPQTPFAKSVSAFIIFCVIFSCGAALVEIEYPPLAESYFSFFRWSELIVLIIFCIEYSLRIISAPNRWRFIWHPFNLIDLASIVVFFFGFHAGIIRALRILRLLKLARHLHILGIFRYKNTILEKIFPLLSILSVAKALIWFLESRQLWIATTSLGELFAIIGFALGIILAEKIATTQGKYFAIRASFFHMEGLLQAMVAMLPQEKEVWRTWAEYFLTLFKNETSNTTELIARNNEMFETIRIYEAEAADIAMTGKELINEAVFLLQKRSDFVPQAYNLLLQQATLLYLTLIVIFLPGAIGLISMIVATYILYGLYHVTVDFDTVIGEEYNLINVDTDQFQSFLHFLADKKT